MSIDTPGGKIVVILILSLATLAIRFYMILPGLSRRRRSEQMQIKGADGTKKCSVAVFLGSGQ